MNIDLSTPAGTYVGHWGPGLLFVAWATMWLLQVVRSGQRNEDAPLEAGWIPPVLRILVMAAAIVIELPNGGWSPQSYVMAQDHIGMYSGFMLSAVVDLLAYRRVLANRVTHLAFAAASLNAALHFAGHGLHPGVESTVHLLLILSFIVLALSLIAETILKPCRLDWLRMGATLSLGGWFVIAGWILFRSGWDLSDPIRIGRTCFSRGTSWLPLA
jgi:hypothetical protein